MTATIVRLVLTALMVVGVYRETGIFTATAIALLSIANELSALAHRQLRRGWRRAR